MTVVGFLSVFNALGLPQAALRFIPAYSATGKFESLRSFLVRALAVLLAANLVLGVAVLLAGPWIALRVYHTPELQPFVGMFVLIMLLGVFTTFLAQVLGGYKAVARRTVISNFVGIPATMVITVILVSLGLGLSGYVLAQIFSAVLVLGLMAGTAWRLTPRAARAFSSTLPSLEKGVMSFSGAALGLGLLQYLMSETDRVVLGIYRDAREVGIYAVAGSLIIFVTVVLRSVNQIFAPVVSGLSAGEQRAVVSRMFQTLTKWILGLTIPLAAGMIFFASGLMGIFGRDFRAGWLVLVIGTVGQLVNCGVGSSGTLLFMTGHQNALVKIHASMAALMVGLNLALTPRWGMTGAAISMAATVCATNLWYLLEVRRRLGLSPYNRSYLRLLVPLAGALAVLWLWRARLGALHPQWLTIGAAVLLAYAIFISLALALGLDEDDRMIARAVWSRVRSVIPRAEAGV